uniref:Myeloid cell nuclear differentiation antigen n=1 Tax=Loxodonta africana TaxID=9785 RepID=G3TAS2_LOXAF
QKKKNTAKEKPVAKKKKVSQEQSQPPCPSGASSSATVGHSPPPQISSPTPSFTSLTENQRPQAQHQVATKKNALPNSPIVVRVLKATEAFEFESSEESKDMMFHATVVTENTFFQVKVFNINLKEKFTPKRVIVIKGYSESKGILEIKEASSVSEAGPDQKIEVPVRIIKRANETPKIDNLQKQASGTFVYGLFMLHKKTVNKKSTIYEIQDDTGKMDVVGKRKWHNIMCEEGDKLRLFCFQLRMMDYKLKLISGTHSFIKERGDITTETNDSKRMKLTLEQRQVPQTSAPSTSPTEGHPQSCVMPSLTPSSNSLTKKIKDEITGIHDTKRIKLPQGQYQLPQTLQTISPPLQSLPQTPQMLLLTPSSSFLT